MSALMFEVPGCEGPKEFFSRLSAQTLAHGYLFTGEAGSGKKRFARALARSLLCQAPHPQGVLGYDGTCESCALIGKEGTRHPDLLESLGPLKIGERDAPLGFHEGAEMTSRDLVRQLSLQSYAGGFRVFILGDVEFASPAAANALLKFFEEPPDKVVLLLTSSTPARLIGTIRSRLVEVRFARQGAGDRGQDELRERVAQWFFEAASGGSPDGWASRETLDEGIDTIKTLLRDWVALGTAGDRAPMLAASYRTQLAALPPIGAARANEALEKIADAQRLARTNVAPALVGELIRMAITP